MKTKILILHTSVGYGIKVTAQNIHSELAKNSALEVRIEDIQEVESGGFVSSSEKVYTAVLDHMSSLWGFLYDSRLIMALTLPLRKLVASFKSKRTLKLLREFQPAMVISTQAAPTAVIAYLKSKGLYRGKLVAVFSDYHLHPFWLFDEVDLYICNIAEQAVELRRMGVSEERIAVTGMPLPEKFFNEIPRDEACAQAGLLTTMPTVLLTSGGRARNAVKEVYLRLLRSPKTFQVAVVAGRNEELKKELEMISAPVHHPVKIFGYVNNMDVLMSAARVMIGKTGGPTMAEAVAKKLPMVLTDVRPGHEYKNLEYLVRNGIADYGRIPREAVFLVEEILDGRIKRSWPNCHEKILKPNNSITVSQAVLKALPDPVKTAGLKVKNYQDSQ
jgi:processive 1,2-diacylglycerol beta-glucosyltransferase